jgi:hypothetical protein
MPFGLANFKASFGRKPAPVDTLDPKKRYDALLTQVGPKIQGGMKLGHQESLDAWAALKLRVDRKDWHAAADVLQEAQKSVRADIPRARDLTQKLDAAYASAVNKFAPKEPSALKGQHADGNKAVSEDRYDDAQAAIQGMKDALAEFDRQKILYESRAGQAAKARDRIAGWVMAQPADARPGDRLVVAERQIAQLDVAERDRNYDNANQILDSLLQAASVAGDVAADKPEPTLWEERIAASGPQFDAVEQQLAAGGLGKPPVGLLRAPGEAFSGALREARAAAAKGDHATANARLTDATVEVGKLVDAARRERVGRRTNTLNDPVDYRGWPASAPASLKPRQAALKQAETDMFAALKKADHLRALEIWLTVQADWEALQPCFVADRDATRKVFQERVQKEAKADQALATRYEQILQSKDPAALRTALLDKGAKPDLLRSIPGGPKMLDDLVRDMGPKVDTPEKRELITLAMKARFDLSEVSGGEDGKGLSSKALPRMYKLLAMLPDEHVTTNDLIKSIERQKGSDTSTYSTTDKKVVLKAGKAGKAGSTFDDTTLHEIGHGVDSKFSFMASNGSALKYGGWRTETLDDIADTVAGGLLGFYADFKAVPADLLRRYVRAVLSGTDPKTLQGQFEHVKGGSIGSPKDMESHPAVVAAAKGHADLKTRNKQSDSDLTRDLFFACAKLIKDPEPKRAIVTAITKSVAEGAVPADAVKARLEAVTITDPLPSVDLWKQMSTHRAIDFAANVRLNPGDNGLWGQGNSGAGQYAVNGRVYQEAYNDDWVSYALSARATAVCDYQFRHRMEWFAECYSRYFLKTLSPAHPLAAWLATQVKASPSKA